MGGSTKIVLLLIVAVVMLVVGLGSFIHGRETGGMTARDVNCLNAMGGFRLEDVPEQCRESQADPTWIMVGQLLILLGGILLVGSIILWRRTKKIREIMDEAPN